MINQVDIELVLDALRRRLQTRRDIFGHGVRTTDCDDWRAATTDECLDALICAAAGYLAHQRAQEQSPQSEVSMGDESSDDVPKDATSGGATTSSDDEAIVDIVRTMNRIGTTPVDFDPYAPRPPYEHSLFEIVLVFAKVVVSEAFANVRPALESPQVPGGM